MKTLRHFTLYCFALLLSVTGALAQSFQLEETEKVKAGKGQFYRNLVYKKYRTKASLRLPVAQEQALLIDAGAGSLEIEGTNGDQLEVEALIITSSLRKKATGRFIKKYLELDTATTRKGDLKVKSKFSLLEPRQKVSANKWGEEREYTVYKFPLWRALGTPVSKIHLRVKVPRGVALHISDRSGPVVLQNLQGNVYLSDRSGRVTINNLDGDLVATDRSGRFVAKNISGSFQVQDRSGRLQIQQAGTAGQHNQVKDRSGRVILQEVAGHLELDDFSGRIQLKDIAGQVAMSDRSGKIYVNGTSGSLAVTDRSGEIVLKNIGLGSNVTASIYDKSGGITVTGLPGDSVIKDRSGKIQISGIKGDISVSDRSGGIYIRKFNGEIRLKDRSGKVRTDGYVVLQSKKR